MRVVLDANVIVAAFAARGLCEAVFELCLDAHEILISEDLLVEIGEGLNEKIKLPPSTVSQIIRLLREDCTFYVPKKLSPNVCRDPHDVHVLGLAVASEAEYLITGDKDLLSVKRIENCCIVSPRRFSDLIHEQE